MDWLTEKRIALIGLLVALCSCLGTWLALPDGRMFIASLSNSTAPVVYQSPTVEITLPPTVQKQEGTRILPTLTRRSNSVVNSTPVGKIAFFTHRSTNAIYVVNADGTNLHKFADQQIFEGFSWSPDGRLMAFGRVELEDQNQRVDIYVANADGTNQRKIWENGAPLIYDLVWSPNGQFIAFVDIPDSYTTLIHIIRPDGTQVKKFGVTPPYNNGLGWSADSQSITYGSTHDSRVVEINTANESVNALFLAEGTYPAWSPTNNFIAYCKSDGIYLMEADRTNSRKIQNTVKRDCQPSWSPDGNFLAFTSFGDAYGGDIYIIGVDGSNRRNLTDNPSNINPSWAPP